jgi:hypothetical protein
MYQIASTAKRKDMYQDTLMGLCVLSVLHWVHRSADVLLGVLRQDWLNSNAFSQ